MLGMLFLLAALSVCVLGTPVVDLDDALALTEQGRGDIESLLKDSDVDTLSSTSSKLSKDDTQTLMSTDSTYIDSTLTISNDRRWSMNLDFPEVQDVGTCSNSDYAIVTAAAVSAARKIHLDTSLEPLSAQQVLECSTAQSGNNACLGGSVVTALEYVSDNILCKTSAYPWTGSYSNQYECDTHQGVCIEDAPRTVCGEKNASICGFLEVGQGTGQDAFNPDPRGVGEDALKLAVYHQPVIGILQLSNAASLEAFKDYKREDQPLSSSLCGGGGESSHVPVLITGYDTSQWILHPAYGSGFGDSGAVYLSRDNSVDDDSYSRCFKAAYVPCISQNCLSQ